MEHENEEQDEVQERPEQAAALNVTQGEERDEDEPQDQTDSNFFDTPQHSDQPGPFGTS